MQQSVLPSEYNTDEVRSLNYQVILNEQANSGLQRIKGTLILHKATQLQVCSVPFFSYL